MKYCGDRILQDFLNRLVETLKYENNSRKDDRKYDCEAKDDIDIPFVVSSLWQSFKNNKFIYHFFKNDIREFDYDIEILSSDDSYEIAKAVVNLYDVDKDECLPYYYVIEFLYDERYFGYCECKEGDDDYDERHCCCGHGCDWYAPEFALKKVDYITKDSWNGDEHDYWDFEDSFYSDDKAEKEKKEEQEREYNIRRLKEEIADAQKKLKELERRQ